LLPTVERIGTKLCIYLLGRIIAVLQVPELTVLSSNF